MRKPIAGFWWSPSAEGIPALVVTAVFFALGGVGGSLVAFQAANGGAEALCSYIERFLRSAQDGGINMPDLLQLFWTTFRWPLGVVALGFSAFGLIGIPVLSGARGFFLGFSIAAFARAYGYDGLTVAFLVQGVPGVLAVPAFFVLAAQSFSASCSLAVRLSGQGRRDLPYHKEFFFRCGGCVAALCASLLLERFLVPVLVTGLAGSLLPSG